MDWRVAVQVFLNVEEDCEGPEMLFQPGVEAAAGCVGLRTMLVREHDMLHRYFPASEVAASQAEMLGKFA